jgi:hypothetical protein
VTRKKKKKKKKKKKRKKRKKRKRKRDFSSQKALGEEEVLASLEMTGASGEKEEDEKQIPHRHLRQPLRPLTAGERATGFGMTHRSC